jgi:hypothetical protein
MAASRNASFDRDSEKFFIIAKALEHNKSMLRHGINRFNLRNWSESVSTPVL